MRGAESSQISSLSLRACGLIIVASKVAYINIHGECGKKAIAFSYKLVVQNAITHYTQWGRVSLYKLVFTGKFPPVTYRDPTFNFQDTECETESRVSISNLEKAKSERWDPRESHCVLILPAFFIFIWGHSQSKNVKRDIGLRNL